MVNVVNTSLMAVNPESIACQRCLTAVIKTPIFWVSFHTDHAEFFCLFSHFLASLLDWILTYVVNPTLLSFSCLSLGYNGVPHHNYTTFQNFIFTILSFHNLHFRVPPSGYNGVSHHYYTTFQNVLFTISPYNFLGVTKYNGEEEHYCTLLKRFLEKFVTAV